MKREIKFERESRESERQTYREAERKKREMEEKYKRGWRQVIRDERQTDECVRKERETKR